MEVVVGGLLEAPLLSTERLVLRQMTGGDVGFAEMGLNRIEATIGPENTRSVNVVERLGFRKEGLLRERFFYGGRRRDELVYGLLRSDREAGLAV